MGQELKQIIGYDADRIFQPRLVPRSPTVHLYHLPIVLRGLIRMNSIFRSACKVSTGCSGVCYGCKTLTDPQTTPFPINRTKCPTALQTHTWWNMSHKRWQYEIYYKETLIIFLKIVSGCCSQPCGSPVLLAAPGCAVVTKDRFSRLRLSLSSPDHCLHVCNSFNTIKKASRKMKSLYVTFHENVKMWKWERNVSSLCSSSDPGRAPFQTNTGEVAHPKKTPRKELVFRKVEQHFERKIIQGNLSINVINCI